MNAEDIPRYENPSPQELNERFRDPTPAESMDACAHGHACLRMVGMLCFDDPDWGRHGSWREVAAALDKAARWAGCDNCEHWEDVNG